MMKTRKYIVAAGCLFCLAALPGELRADGLKDTFSQCVEKYANHNQSVSVMLECQAAGGKLSDCKMVEGPSPVNGFDKAAMCVASSLPVGTRTGTIKVPIRFEKI
jgi:hypothetical protein